MRATNELIRTWEEDGFKLELYDTFTTSGGKTLLGYRFWDHDQLLFVGEDFGASPLHAIDDDNTVAALLGFLSLRPGDTDSDYFESYTAEQLEWCQSSRAEWLAILANDLESAAQAS